jgi:hypothetical protein
MIWTIGIWLAVAWVALSLSVVLGLCAYESWLLSREEKARERAAERRRAEPRVRSRIVSPEDAAGDVPFSRFLHHKD